MLITTEGIIIQLNVSEVSVLGRITSGVKLMDLDSDKKIVVASMTKVRDAIPENVENAEEKLLEELERESDLTEEDIIETSGNSDTSLEKLINRAEEDKEE